MPNREEAWKLLCEYTQSENLRKHALAVEACVRAYARKFGGDEALWGVTALLHDFDYERYPNAPDHPLEGSKILRARSVGRWMSLPNRSRALLKYAQRIFPLPFSSQQSELTSLAKNEGDRSP